MEDHPNLRNVGIFTHLNPLKASHASFLGILGAVIVSLWGRFWTRFGPEAIWIVSNRYFYFLNPFLIKISFVPSCMMTAVIEIY